MKGSVSHAPGDLSLSDKPEEWITKLINRDGCFKDLTSLLEPDSDVAGSGQATFSGTRETDYPLAQSHMGGEVEVYKTFSLPPDLIERFSSMQKNCLMGIFPVCERAWITVDNELFMWNYEDGEDLAYYDGIKSTITCVGLAFPRQGVLPECIRHLLCISTPLELVILGVTYSTWDSGQSFIPEYPDTVDDCAAASRNTVPILQVMPDPLYSVSTENQSITCIEATLNGRIFMGTREGNLLEFTYGTVPGLCTDSCGIRFDGQSGPCTLINHSSSALRLLLLPVMLTASFTGANDPICQLVTDSDRRLLYARTEDSCLAVYAYNEQSDGSFSRIATLSSSDLAYKASSLVRSVDKGQFKRLVSIHCLSGGCLYHLMAVTKTGIRLYFGEHLRLVHIRLPPASPHGTVGLSEVKLVVESRGTVLFLSSLSSTNNSGITGSDIARSSLASPRYSIPSYGNGGLMGGSGLVQSGGDDFGLPPHVLYTISPDPYPWATALTETFTAAWCVGGAWALTLLPQDRNSLDSAFVDTNGTLATANGVTNNDGVGRGEPPVVLTQHLDPPYRRLLLISAHGLVHLRLATPLTRLRDFLNSGQPFGLDGVSLSGGRTGSLANTTSLNQSLLHSIGPHNPPSTRAAPYPLNVTDDLDLCNFAFRTTDFLTIFLHQFSPEEAICAALFVGASQTVNLNSDTQSQVTVSDPIEQAILFFAAEAAQLWTPNIRRPSIFAQLNHPPTSRFLPQSSSFESGGNIPASTTGCADKSVSVGLFLFSGVCLFLARLARTFWRSPLFRDATHVSHRFGHGVPTKSNKSKSNDRRGVGSWMRTFVSVLASASPLRTWACGTQTQPEQLLISRLDPDEISWLWHQLTYLQQFVRKQLSVRGGWLRPLFTPTNAAALNRPTATGDVDAQCTTTDSVMLHRLTEELDHLLTVMLELLGFWRILSEHVVHRVVRSLNEEQRSLLLQLPFEAYAASLLSDASAPLSATTHQLQQQQQFPDLVSSNLSPAATCAVQSTTPPIVNTGADLMTALLTALVDYYLTEACQNANSSVSLDTITARLQSVCPNLFANEDALCAKASECLLQANMLCVEMDAKSHELDNKLKQTDNPLALNDPSLEVDRLVSEALQLYHDAGPGLDLEGAVQRLENTGAWLGAISLCLSVAGSRDPSDVAMDCLKHGRRPSSEPLFLQCDTSMTTDKRGRRHQLYMRSELAATEGRYDAYRCLTGCIDRLWELGQSVSTASAKDLELLETSLAQTNTVQLDLTPVRAHSLWITGLRRVMKSDDVLAHFELLGWLLSRGLSDTAVSLNSPHLESYVRSRLRQSPDDPDLRCLLWRQLEHRGARLEAAQVLEHLAVTPCPRLTLENRLDFATRAVVAVKALPASQQDLEYLRDLESRLEVAQLQQQLYSELNHLHPVTSLGTSVNLRSSPPRYTGTDENLNEALSQLSHGPLLTPTEMFTYADKFGLHESKLHLLWVSGSQDPVLVRAIWRDLLQNILSSALDRSPGGRRYTSSRIDSSPYRRVSPLRGNSDGRSVSAASLKLVQLALVDCLSRLGHRFAVDGTLSSRSQIFFPLSEIVSTLEHYGIQHTLPNSWVPTVLRDTRLMCISNITDAYDQLLHSKEAFWRHPQVRNRLFIAFITIIEDFLGSAMFNQLPMRLRMLHVGRLVDQVTASLVDLNSDTVKASSAMSDSDIRLTDQPATVRAIVDRLRTVHDQLQKYFR